MEEINEKVYEKAVKLLAIRLHTTGELHRKLKARGFQDQDIVSVLRKLEEAKFLDDERFAQIFVDNLKRYKDFGYYGIKARLLKRLIPSDMSERALREFFTLADEEGVARRLLAKLSSRGKSLPVPASPAGRRQAGALGGKKHSRKDWEQLAQALQRRGFRNQVVAKLLFQD